VPWPRIISGSTAAAIAADADSGSPSNGIEQVIVTADRRDESVQAVPNTVQAFSGQALADLNVATLDDLLRYTPNITYGNNGPGQGEIIMRGLSNGFAATSPAARSATSPMSRSIWTDQSMQFPARSTSTSTMVDMNRVEVLEGPQGTLFRRRRRGRRGALHHQQAQSRHLPRQSRGQLWPYLGGRGQFRRQSDAQCADHRREMGGPRGDL